MTDDERIKAIENVSKDYIKEALHWWNTTADKVLKRFVIIAAYQETIAVSMTELDDDLSTL